MLASSGELHLPPRIASIRKFDGIESDSKLG
jgi:hypothetical protein